VSLYGTETADRWCSPLFDPMAQRGTTQLLPRGLRSHKETQRGGMNRDRNQQNDVGNITNENNRQVPTRQVNSTLLH
jgi:hypothetical protein